MFYLGSLVGSCRDQLSYSTVQDVYTYVCLGFLNFFSTLMFTLDYFNRSVATLLGVAVGMHFEICIEVSSYNISPARSCFLLVINLDLLPD